MWLFRRNETSERRGWLSRLINRENGGQPPAAKQAAAKPGGGRAETTKPVSPAEPSKPVNVILKRCPNCEDLESQATEAQEKSRTCTIASGITFSILFPFIIFAVVSLVVFFYRQDVTLNQKWTYLTDA